MTDETPDVVSRARAALDGITPGLWALSDGWRYPSSQITSDGGHVVIYEQDEEGGESWSSDEDARFIADSPDLVRDLLAEVELLRDDLRESRAAVDRVRKELDDIEAGNSLADPLAAIGAFRDNRTLRLGVARRVRRALDEEADRA